MTREKRREAIEYLKKYREQALEQESCDDAISRQAVLVAMRNNYRDGGRDIDGDYVEGNYSEKLYNVINTLPPVIPEPKTGHWIEVYQGDEIINYRCSECELGDTNGSTNLYEWDYCRRCGARMVKPQERRNKE